MNDLESCKKYVKNFLDENYGKGNITDQLEWFKTYNFSKLAKEEKVDEDNTKLAKAVYLILWHGKLPFLENLENMEEYYGGETINTFNTLFQSEFLGIKEFVPLTEENAEFYLNVIKFRINYLTIGNFMLLPKLSVNGSSLNTAKGTCYGIYKDYADLFFVELFKENSELQYLKDANKFYFNEISVKEFCEKNFLKDYFENDKPKKIFLHLEDNQKYYPYFWWQNFKDKLEKGDEYKNFAKDYMEQANAIIKYRADRICEILETELNQTSRGF